MRKFKKKTNITKPISRILIIPFVTVMVTIKIVDMVMLNPKLNASANFNGDNLPLRAF
jgi:hypothetical protein